MKSAQRATRQMGSEVKISVEFEVGNDKKWWGKSPSNQIVTENVGAVYLHFRSIPSNGKLWSIYTLTDPLNLPVSVSLFRFMP